ncbi:sugar phosphatase [Arsenophonus apicola]|uniref:Sugar phosphatase n=1 Tax=Arsenophonus apicola TaxID=2879119 RepID=A0ABY8P4S9_9GAMM|nr:sugar phosphatase [Arsenophonus apicola]WGO84483.1 sugar phosphatase [Arsenophonus apicola]
MVLKCKGFLFDLDGTLVDSLPNVEHCWREFSRRIGVSETDVLHYIHGKPAINSIRHFMPNATETEIDEVFYWLENLEAANTSGIVALPGAIALLEQLNAYAIPWAIVTSGTIPIAFNRSKAAGLPEPKHWVTIERVEQGKPQPDPFLLGAQLLNLPPEACIAVEDAQAGIYSALDAGCQVIAVHAPVGMPRREEISLIIKSFTELNISQPDNQGIVTVTQR